MNPKLLGGLAGGVTLLLTAPLLWLAVSGRAVPRNLALTMVFIMCILGPSIVISATGFASIGALGRNPSAAPKILTAMTITLIFAEAVAVIAFLVVWQLFTPT
jgi:F0F1-type ATP synthase membrane subunit c/vacuolar-type H+-ATPase subunit K